MEKFTDLAIILKSFRYAERDLVAVFFSENHGKMTGMAKGAVHSRRYGGALGFLAVSQVSFVRKPHADMARIDGAAIHHEFKNIPADMTRLAVAGFMAETCLKLLEPDNALREMFVVLSNSLHKLDGGTAPLTVLNAFLVKTLRALGYAPSFGSCARCAKSSPVVLQEGGALFWDSSHAHLICGECAHGGGGLRSAVTELPTDVILLALALQSRPFKDLDAISRDPGAHLALYRLLNGFLHQQIPAIHAGGGMKSLRVIDDSELVEGLGAPLPPPPGASPGPGSSELR